MNKKTVILAFVSVFLLSMTLCIRFNLVMAQEPETKFYVDPPKSAAWRCTTFTINLIVADVTGLFGWEFKLYWDNRILNCTGAAVYIPAGINWEPPNSLEAGPGIQQNYNATHGRYYKALGALPMQQPYPKGFNGTMVLATLTFHCTGVGECVLHLVDTILGDAEVNPIPHSVVDGYFSTIPSIQAAINAASPGDTILVPSGTYYEHVIVNKTVSLIGENTRTTNIDGNGTGTAVVLTADNVYISGFTIRNCSSLGSCGIDLSGTAMNTIIGNTVTSNVRGFYLGFNSSNNSISENTIMDNFQGIVLLGSCDNTIYHNNFVNNTEQAYDNGTSSWDNGYEGNYWSDYNGTDLDGDGIGNTFLPHQGVDNYPLMSPYMEGDVDHNAIVNVLDVLKVAVAFGSTPEDSWWNPHSDLTEDKIINVLDILLVAIHFGETW